MPPPQSFGLNHPRHGGLRDLARQVAATLRIPPEYEPLEGGKPRMSDIVKRLRERRNNVWEQAKEIADRAADENRALSGEEEGSWQALNAELDALDKRIKNVLDGEMRAKEAEEAFGKLSGKPRVDGQRDDRDGSTNTDDAQFRAFLRGDPSTGRCFDVRAPVGRPVDFRTLSKLTAAAGLNTVPTTFYERLMQHMIETSAILRSGVTILNTSGGEVIQVPKTTAHSTAAIVTEGAAIAASDPAFGQISLGAFKYGTLVQVSRELIDDTGVDLEGYMAQQTGRALGNAFGAHAVVGTGTGQPRGIVTDATVGVTGGTGVAGVPTADNLIDLYYSVIAPYRNSSSAAFLAKDSTIAALRKIKDTTGQYLWQPGLTEGTPDTFIGKPLLTDPYVAATGVNAKSVVFGDLSQYFVRIAGGVRFERSDEYAFNTDLVTFRALLRGDGALVDTTGAVKVYVGAAT